MVTSTKHIDGISSEPHQDPKGENVLSVVCGDFPPAAEHKPNSFPLKYQVANSSVTCPLWCPSRSFLGLISRFWTPMEYLHFSLISTDGFPFFLCGILASWRWSRFLTYSPYVRFCGLGGHSPLPHPITLCSELGSRKQTQAELSQQHMLVPYSLGRLPSWSHPESSVDEPAFSLKGYISGNPLKYSC